MYFAKEDESGSREQRDRPEDNAGVPRIEITPAMIEAGLQACERWRPGSADAYGTNMMICDVYKAMRMASWTVIEND